MRPTLGIRLVSLVVLLLAASPLGHAASAAPAGAVPIAVVVSAQSTLREISMGLLRRVFLGEPSEHAGLRFVPLNYGPDDPLRAAFDQQVLGMSRDTSGRYWVDRRIRGQGLPPRTIPNSLLLRAVVARLPGSIGYLRADQLDATVRALRLDGVAHDNPAYPLRVVRP